MTEDTFQNLLTVLSNIAPERVDNLNPPLAEAELGSLTQHLPFALPDDLQTLYRRHNGEDDKKLSGMLFGLPWLSLEVALGEWKGWRELADDDFSGIDESIVSVPEGHIKKNYINTHYFPISHDSGGNNIGIDLDPGPKGTKGQIINYGSDENTRYVIAPSLNDFLAFCIYQLQSGNYSLKEEDGETSLLLKEPDNAHFLDTLSQLDLPFTANRAS